MAITFNATTIPQPTGLNESTGQVHTDHVAIDGGRQRDRIGQKKVAVLKWAYLSTADYQTLLTFVETGAALAYSNTTSNRSGGTFSFTGLPDYQEGDYIRGGTLIRGFEITLNEV